MWFDSAAHTSRMKPRYSGVPSSAAIGTQCATRVTFQVRAKDNLPQTQKGPQEGLSPVYIIVLDVKAEEYVFQVQLALELQIRQRLENTLKELQDSTEPNYFRVQRVRFEGSADLSRRLVSRLFIAGRAAVEHARFTALDGPSVFASQYGQEVEGTDVNGRIALVWDSRNNEYNPRNGLLLEGGFQAGGAGGENYTRLYTVLQGYMPVRASTVLAARFAASDIRGTPSFNSRFYIPTWEDPTPVYGGYTSNRGFGGGRFVGNGVVFGSVELRQDFLPLGEIASGVLIAFLDAGRVFEGENFTIDGKALHVAGGIGIGARLLRATIFTANLAKSSEGWRVSGGASWAF
jgi:hypothetical protein